MARIESVILSTKSAEDVFSFLNRCESHEKFIPRMMDLDQTSPGIFGQAGTTLSGVLNYCGIRIPVKYEIIQVEPNQQLAMKGEMGPVLFKDGYVLKQKGDRTEIQFWLELLPQGWTKIFSPFMGLIARIHAWETLRNLRQELLKQEIASSSFRSSSQ